MIRNIPIFLVGLSLLILNSTGAFGQEQQESKIYNYEQKTINKAVKKDLKITAAIFVSENNLKIKDSLFNPPQDELLQASAISVDKADIKIDNSQQQVEKKTDSGLVTGLLTDALRESGKFAIVERQDINAILREAEFSNSKWVNSEQANKIGNVYGVKYIVIANLLKSEAGERVAINNYALALRLCEVETGNISATGEGEGVTIKDAIANAVKNFSSKINSLPWGTRIVRVGEGFVYIGAGSDEGLKQKDILEVYKSRDKIIDPVTAKDLGTEKTKIGRLEIVEVLSPVLSKAKVLESLETITTDFIVQAIPTEGVGTDEMAKWKKIYGDVSSLDKPKAEVAGSSPAVADAGATNMSMSIEGLVQVASPAIVMITTVSNTGGALGSGFLISSDGTIVTNYHVIKGAEGLGVKFAQEKELISNVSVIKTDAIRDIALIKINTPVNATPLSLGDSEQIVVGERVVAIGNPQGLQNTISDGLVSAVRDAGGVKQIQISVPISHGSSGGALLNMRGQVIGITSSGIDQAQNLNFAIPINYVKEYLQQ
ncbi:MAG: trypsin-like peptidase domain-containing protein [Candidatus Omnitrophica bacterium]|jgi:curli biogenesis system outer membrane secretion channel CsgG|nr:trypsin-like peptidase domain-containing protein [Candidatus Omnitrophota bacterium]MDD5252354.1 trypsin-like peptidase domain-containing protein [Candidatus Omnitrophota bacterium]